MSLKQEDLIENNIYTFEWFDQYYIFRYSHIESEHIIVHSYIYFMMIITKLAIVPPSFNSTEDIHLFSFDQTDIIVLNANEDQIKWLECCEYLDKFIPFDELDNFKNNSELDNIMNSTKKLYNL